MACPAPLPPASRWLSPGRLRCHLAELSGRAPQTLGPGAITYQLRRLRLHGMIQRLPNSHRYHVTEPGFRAALFFTRTSLLRPGIAAALPGHRSIPNPLKHAFDKIDARITASINQLALAA